MHSWLCITWKSVISIIHLPADVVYGDVPELLIHGRLAFLTGMGTEGGLGMLIGHVNLNLTGPFLQKKNDSFLQVWFLDSLHSNDRTKCSCTVCNLNFCDRNNRSHHWNTGCGIYTAWPEQVTAPPGSLSETWWRSEPPPGTAHTTSLDPRTT